MVETIFEQIHATGPGSPVVALATSARQQIVSAIPIQISSGKGIPKEVSWAEALNRAAEILKGVKPEEVAGLASSKGQGQGSTSSKRLSASPSTRNTQGRDALQLAYCSAVPFQPQPPKC